MEANSEEAFIPLLWLDMMLLLLLQSVE